MYKKVKIFACSIYRYVVNEQINSYKYEIQEFKLILIYRRLLEVPALFRAFHFTESLTRNHRNFIVKSHTKNVIYNGPYLNFITLININNMSRVSSSNSVKIYF